MDWSSVSDMVQSQLKTQLALFVGRIHAQDAELLTLRAQVASLEARLQLASAVASSPASTATSPTPAPPAASHTSATSSRYRAPPARVLETHTAVAASAPPSPSSSQFQQARALSQMMADDDALEGARGSPDIEMRIEEEEDADDGGKHLVEDDVRTHVPPKTPQGHGKKRAVSPGGDSDEEPTHKKPKNGARSVATSAPTVFAAPSQGRPPPSFAATPALASHAMLDTQSIDPTPTATSARKKALISPKKSPPLLPSIAAASATSAASPAIASNVRSSKSLLAAAASPAAPSFPSASTKHRAGRLDLVDSQEAAIPPSLPSTHPRGSPPPPPAASDMHLAEEAYEMFGGIEDHADHSDAEDAHAHPPSERASAFLDPIPERKEDSVTRPTTVATVVIHPPRTPSPSKPSALDLLTSAFPPAVVAAAAAAPPVPIEMSPLPPASEPLVSAELRASAEVIANAGVSLAGRSDWSASLAKLDEAVGMLAAKSWKEVPIAWLKQRSTVHAKMGHNIEAHADAQRMIEHQPQAWAGYYILSTLLGRDKHYADALIQCKNAWARVEKRKKGAPAVAVTRAEKDADADRKKIIERVRQLELRLHLPACIFNEEEEEPKDDPPQQEAKEDHTPFPMLSPPIGGEREVRRSILNTPQHAHTTPVDPIVSPASTRAPTAPSSPMPPANALPSAAQPSPRKLDFHSNVLSASKASAIQPLLTLGTYKLTGAACLGAVTAALRMGYRRIDTAASYKNEDIIGRALTASGIARSSVYITSKIAWSEMASEETAYAAGMASLKRLDTKYLDCLLIHFPGRAGQDKSSPLHATGRLAAWRAAERLVGEGRVRSIGVANFEIKHLSPLLAVAKVKPRVNQIELHPLLYRTQMQLIEFCRSKGIDVEAYGSLGMGKPDLNALPIIASIARSCRRSQFDVLLQWSLQHGFIPLAKSASPARLQANFGVTTKPFTLTQEQMTTIDELEATHHTKRFAWDPTWYA